MQHTYTTLLPSATPHLEPRAAAVMRYVITLCTRAITNMACYSAQPAVHACKLGFSGNRSAP